MHDNGKDRIDVEFIVWILDVDFRSIQHKIN